MKNSRLCKIPIWLWAFLLNFAAAAAAVGPFLIRDRGLIAMSCDFSAQEIPFQIFMNETIRSGNLLWNWAIDIGGNFLESFSFYNLGSIFTWLTALVPVDKTPYVMGWMIMLKFAAAGGTSAIWLDRHLTDPLAVLTASLMYAFSGYQCADVVFYYFSDMLILFPLFVLTLELLVEENRKGLFAVVCAASALCNYVFFVGEVLFLVIFYIVRYLIPEITARERSWSHIFGKIGQCMLEGVAGVMMAGILLLPSINGVLGNSRVSKYLQGRQWLKVTTEDWLNLVKAFFMPAEIMNRYSSVTDANWMSKAAYLPVTGVLLVAAYLFSRKKDWLDRVLKTFFVIALVPILNSSFMMFSRENYCRWYYMLILFMVLATAKVLEDPGEYRIRGALIFCFGVLAYFVWNTLVVWDYRWETAVLAPVQYGIGIVAAVAGILASAVIVYRFRELRMQAMLILTAVCSALCLFYTVWGYRSTTDNNRIDFHDLSDNYSKSIVTYLTEIAGQQDRNALPYRYDMNEGLGHSYYNMALTNSLPTINSFLSTIHPSVLELHDVLELDRTTWNNDGYPGMRELLSTRYILTTVEEKDYTFRETLQNHLGQTMLYYENEGALPIGFTYDCYITRTELLHYSPVVRPKIMLAALVVEDEDRDSVKQVLRHASIRELRKAMRAEPADLQRMHNAECSTDFQTGRNRFSVTMVSDGEKYAFFSVPFDRYWKAQVNGESCEVLNINGLMAVRLHSGENEIQFVYDYIPLKAGIAVSVAGMILLLIYLAAGEMVLACFERRKEKVIECMGKNKIRIIIGTSMFLYLALVAGIYYQDRAGRQPILPPAESSSDTGAKENEEGGSEETFIYSDNEYMYAGPGQAAMYLPMEDILVTEADTRNLLEENRLPALQRMAEEDAGKYMSNLQALKRIEAMQISPSVFHTPEYNWKTVYSDSLVKVKNALVWEDVVPFDGVTASELNRFLKRNQNCIVDVRSEYIKLDETIVVPSNVILEGNGVKVIPAYDIDAILDVVQNPEKEVLNRITSVDPEDILREYYIELEGHKDSDGYVNETEIKKEKEYKLDRDELERDFENPIPEYAMLLEDAENVGIYDFNLMGGSRQGIYLICCDRVLIYNNEVADILCKALCVMGECENINIVNNNIHDNGNGAIFLNGDISGCILQGNIVSENRGTRNLTAGIVLCSMELDNIYTPYNEFKDIHLYDILDAPHDNVLIDNHIQSNYSSGIYCDGGYMNYFIDNSLEDNEKEGMCLDYGSFGNYVRGNVVRRNGHRDRQTDEDLEADFILGAGRLEDGSSTAKLPGISLDNAAYNILYQNNVSDNDGSGVKCVRSCYRNVILSNMILNNNKGVNPLFHGFGIEFGHASTPDEPVKGLDFTADFENIAARNVVQGPHYAGIFLAEGSYCNDLIDNILMECEFFSIENHSIYYNSAIGNVFNKETLDFEQQ